MIKHIFRYTKLYLLYKECLEKKDIKQADAFRSIIRDQFEKDFAYEKLVLVRTIATKRFEFEQL
jgi:hypothetical protein